MTLRRNLSAVLMALVALAAPGGRLSVANAEGIPQASGTTLITAVTPSEPTPSESRVILSFSQLIPQFSIIGNDASTAVIAFADTRLTPNLAFPGGKHGLVQSMTFTQNDSILTLTISGNAPIHIAANGLAGRAISVSITGVGAASARPDAGQPSLAAHTDAAAI